MSLSGLIEKYVVREGVVHNNNNHVWSKQIRLVVCTTTLEQNNNNKNTITDWSTTNHVVVWQNNKHSLLEVKLPYDPVFPCVGLVGWSAGLSVIIS